MFNVIKGAISNGGYKLTEIQHKIKKLYMLGDISEAEMDELLSLTYGGASADAERPELLQMIHSLSKRISVLEELVKGQEGSEPDVPAETYPEWKPWDGISKDYKYGSIVSHNGELWQSTFEGHNVWSPEINDERFWVKYDA